MPADGAWIFVQACRLIAKKGLATALRAFARFHQEQPRARFLIAGDGPMRDEVLALAGELGIAEAVELPGFLSQDQLAALYARSHLFVHPSELTTEQNQEGVPNSMLEAMATGLPVLATLHGGIPEAVAHGETGLLVPERDHEALFAAMKEATATPERYHALQTAAAAAVRADFEHSAAVAKLETIYDEARQIGRRAA
jgi:colanic acid/amylovoran biosynthesis glycosyltransferase